MISRMITYPAQWRSLEKNLRKQIYRFHTFHKLDGSHFHDPNEFEYMTDSANAVFPLLSQILLRCEEIHRAGGAPVRPGFLARVAEHVVERAVADVAAAAITHGARRFLVPLVT